MSDNDPLLSDQPLKPRKPKSRGVSSRFLSPITTSQDNAIPSPTPSQASSPLRKKSSDTRKQRSLEDPGFIRGLWPSSITSSSPSHSTSRNRNVGTLADHLGNERLRDFLERKKDEKSVKNSNVFSLSRQRSCSEYSRFDNEKDKEKEKEKESMKENHRPLLGGSMRYTGKLHFPGKSSSSSSSSSSNTLSNNSDFIPGRLSVDENALYRNSKNADASRRKSDSFMDSVDTESECSANCSATDCASPSAGKNSRKSGIEVSSKYLQDVPTRSRRGTSDSNVQHPLSLDASPKTKKFTIRSAIKRANSLTGYGSSTSQWALSPGRSGSPPMSVESKERLTSFSSLKPPSSPSRSKGVEKFLSLGLDILKGKKSSSSSSLMESGNVENIHQLRLLHNRLMQWQYANARADAVNGNTSKQVKNNLLCALKSLANLQRSVLLKKLQLQKEIHEMKLDYILHSQIKQLEAWGDMERQHSAAVFKTKECLHSVVCRIPLIEGAKVDPQLTSIALRHASDLTASIKSSLVSFSPFAEKSAELVSQLAEVVSQEKLLLDECVELFQTISMLEVKISTHFSLQS
ncbi:hypothetical protein GH714_024712 [Hevea brasiliensis]|uniref:QWRF motif-containing protein 3 n=1 Tax=Hevea brasiliensis TaxID=3981 RepID=A0A6A6KF00_HEVBR|nr:hypothetical protein GH714_024712 [Hevea brasiliensis]